MTRTTNRRCVWLIGLTASAALVLTGCGSDDDMPDADTAAVAEPTDEPSDAAADVAAADDDADNDADADADDDADEAGDDATAEDDTAGEDADAADDSDEQTLAAGIYRAYSVEAVAEPGYDTTIVFFHASWCPECRAFEQAIEAGPIPDGVQILKADYDTENELKDRYGVDIQTTFVRVDDDGELLSLWVGYAKERSIDTILTELG